MTSDAEGAAPVRRRLVVLSSFYPYATGDSPFVSSEMSALAARFDEILVANYSAPEPGVTLVEDLPANFRHIGSLDHRKWHALLRGLLSVRRLGRLVETLLRGARAREIRLFKDLRASLIGMAIASDPRLRPHDNAVETTIYAFWGVGVGYALPWLNDLPCTRTAVRVHGFDLYEDRVGYRPIRPAVFHAAHAVLTVTDHGRDYLIDRFPEIQSHHVIVRRLGVFGPSDLTSRHHRRYYEIVSCSNVIPVKRVDTILSVVIELARRGKKLKWTHFGDGELLPEIRHLAETAQTQLSNLEVELLGSRPNDEVMAFHSQKRPQLFINLSLSEGAPVSLMEAASCDIPLLATAVGGTPELVGHNLRSGELVSPTASAKEIADVAEQILENPDFYKPHEVWQTRFAAPENGKQTASTLHDLFMLPHPDTSWR